MTADHTRELKELKYQHLLTKHPTFPPEETRSIAYASKYTDKTANGLTKMICEYVTYKGGFANRINTQGQYDKATNKYRKGSTKKGTPDIDIVWKAIPVKVEVKIGRDTMSPDQLRIKAQIENAGGKYLVATNYDTFYNWINLL